MPPHGRRIRRRRRERRADSVRFSPARITVGVAALLVGFALGMVLLTYGPRAYSGWREGRLLKRASTMLAQENFEGAIQAAREIVQRHPDSLAAFQILAEASEKQNQPETVAWRSQIARLQPRDLDSQLNLASAALRFGQLDTAQAALQRVSPEDTDRAAYHVVAGWLARAQGNEAEVERNFAAAVGREPGNDLYQFNLAVLRIRSNSPEKREEARAVLEQLSKSPRFRSGALRSLLGEAIQREDIERADALAQDLQMSQQVVFSDYLLCLDLYRKQNEDKFGALLTKVKSVAARNAWDVGLLMEWLNKNGMSGDLLKWTEKLPADLTANPPPAVAVADALVEVKNWSRLKRWTRAGSWGDSEFLRFAYQAYGARQSRQSAAEAEFSSVWRSAERAAVDNANRELQLARLATKWGLSVEAEQLWQRVSKDAPSRREALDALYRMYRLNNDLPNLYRTAQRLRETSPNENSLAADYARLALLLDRNTTEGHRVAKETYLTAPDDADVTMTYAFSLYGLGRSAEGIEIMNKLPPDQLKDPHLAVYAALLLLDENRGPAAEEYVVRAQSGSIFPEEKKLLEEALAKAKAAESFAPSTEEPSASPVSTGR